MCMHAAPSAGPAATVTAAADGPRASRVHCGCKAPAQVGRLSLQSAPAVQVRGAGSDSRLLQAAASAWLRSSGRA